MYAAFSDADREQAVSVMQKLAEEDIAFWFTDRFSSKEKNRIEAAYACVIFISRHSTQDEKTRKSIEYAVRYNKKILCIYLEPTPLSPGMELLLNALQFIDKSAFPDDQAFFEKLKSADVFSNLAITPAQKRFAKRRALASVLIPVVAAVAVFFAVVVPLLIVPSVLAANGSMSKVGFGNLSLAELAQVEELKVVGHQTVDREYYAAYFDGDEERKFVMGKLGIKPAGDISDISDLALLKNARHIAFEANQISDISPLYTIHTLEYLTLNCNPIQSVQGIEALQNLREVNLDCTEISDITPLYQIPSLQSISVRDTYVNSIEGVENLKQLTGLWMGNTNITDISPLFKVDFSYSYSKHGFAFDAQGLHLEDYSPLQQVPRFSNISVSGRGFNEILPYIKNKEAYSLYIEKSDIRSLRELSLIYRLRELELSDNHMLTSIDGIEEHSDLTDIRLVGSPNIMDYTPLLKLPRLRQLIITSDIKSKVSVQLEGAKFEIIYEDEQ